jgi:hypothetical protein
MARLSRRGMLVIGLALVMTLAGCGARASGVPQPTLAAGQTYLPTDTPIPTPADPTGQALLRVAQAAAGTDAHGVGAAYDAGTRQLTVTLFIDGIVPDTNAQIATAYARSKALTFKVEDALWASGLTLSQAQVIVMGPAQDEYANITNQWYSIAVLSAPVARRIAWASATPESAWKSYDQTYLRPSFTVADDIITGPVATSTPG